MPPQSPISNTCTWRKCRCYQLLKFREPAHHLRRCSRTISIPALVDANRRVNLGIGGLQIGLTCQESISIDRAGGHPTDALAVPIDHGVAVVRHADALVVEAEA